MVHERIAPFLFSNKQLYGTFVPPVGLADRSRMFESGRRCQYDQYMPRVGPFGLCSSHFIETMGGEFGLEIGKVVTWQRIRSATPVRPKLDHTETIEILKIPDFQVGATLPKSQTYRHFFEYQFQKETV